jgi:hypothetical protein
METNERKKDLREKKRREKKIRKKLTDDKLLVFLQNHSNLRNGVDQVVWTIFGAFWGTNALLLIGLFSSGNQWDRHFVGIIISTIGVLISLIWSLIQIKAIGRVEMHEKSMICVEDILIPDVKELKTYSQKPELSDSTPKTAIKILKVLGLEEVSVRKTMMYCGLVAIILWFGVLLRFIYLWFTC